MGEQTAVREGAWSSTAPPGEFRTYVSPEDSLREFTVRAVVLGALFGLLFGAVSVYVGLRAGLTVSASIPIAVLSISILRAFGRSTILENNIVQTTGSAGESLAAGVMFTRSPTSERSVAGSAERHAVDSASSTSSGSPGSSTHASTAVGGGGPTLSSSPIAKGCTMLLVGGCT